MKDIGLFAKDKTQLIQKMLFVLDLDKNKIKNKIKLRNQFSWIKIVKKVIIPIYNKLSIIILQLYETKIVHNPYNNPNIYHLSSLLPNLPKTKKHPWRNSGESD